MVLFFGIFDKFCFYFLFSFCFKLYFCLVCFVLFCFTSDIFYLVFLLSISFFLAFVVSVKMKKNIFKIIFSVFFLDKREEPFHVKRDPCR